MEYTKENLPQELHRILEFQKIILEYKGLAENTQEELEKWARDNRKQIKSVFPIKGKLYEIININRLYHWDWRFNSTTTYYFKPKNCAFNPANDFRWGWRDINMPTALGDIVDCNNKIISPNERIEITNLKALDESKIYKSQNEFTYVYLMIDKNTGYYKIGRSKQPKIREKTLQSEKPTIELLHTFDALTKDEKILHDMFSEKRVRGEWFDLSGSDINVIQNYFQQ